MRVGDLEKWLKWGSLGVNLKCDLPGNGMSNGKALSTMFH